MGGWGDTYVSLRSEGVARYSSIADALGVGAVTGFGDTGARRTCTCVCEAQVETRARPPGRRSLARHPASTPPPTAQGEVRPSLPTAHKLPVLCFAAKEVRGPQGGGKRGRVAGG